MRTHVKDLASPPGGRQAALDMRQLSLAVNGWDHTRSTPAGTLNPRTLNPAGP